MSIAGGGALVPLVNSSTATSPGDLDERHRLARQQVGHRHGGGDGGLQHPAGAWPRLDECQARLDDRQLPVQLGGRARG